MKKLLPFIFIFSTAGVFGQLPDLAIAKYSENDKLISLTNIVGLNDCPTTNLTGRARKIKVRGNTAKFVLRTTDEAVDIELNLDRVAAAERRVIFRHLVTRSNSIRVAGYSCGTSSAVSAFSIDRVYEN